MNPLHDFDWELLFSIIALFTLGLLIQLSIAPNLFSSHLLFLAFGLLLFFLFSKVDFRIYSSLKTIIYFSMLFALVLTFLLGTEIRGATRWIIIGNLRIQPSEIIKPFLVLFWAIHFGQEENRWKKLLTGILLTLPIILLVFKQPDLGNTIVYLGIFMGILLASGYAGVVSLGIAGMGILAPLLWGFLKDYQKERIIVFLNPGFDPQGTGYNSLQATIAVGSGGIFGKGLGKGTQSHLNFLPERHTDFIFASFAEELGFIGAFILVSIYIFLLYRIIKTAGTAEDETGALTAVGIFSLLAIQIFINIGMNIGLVPITGITLPLLSYGGSSLIATLISLGLIVSVIKKKRDLKILEIK